MNFDGQVTDTVSNSKQRCLMIAYRCYLSVILSTGDTLQLLFFASDLQRNRYIQDMIISMLEISDNRYDCSAFYGAVEGRSHSYHLGIELLLPVWADL